MKKEGEIKKMDQKSQLCVTRINPSFLPSHPQAGSDINSFFFSWLAKRGDHETGLFSSSVILIVQEMRCICLHHALHELLFYVILQERWMPK